MKTITTRRGLNEVKVTEIASSQDEVRTAESLADEIVWIDLQLTRKDHMPIQLTERRAQIVTELASRS